MFAVADCSGGNNLLGCETDGLILNYTMLWYVEEFKVQSVTARGVVPLAAELAFYNHASSWCDGSVFILCLVQSDVGIWSPNRGPLTGSHSSSVL